nr:hypothetical protein [Microvirga sp. HBU67655]
MLGLLVVAEALWLGQEPVRIADGHHLVVGRHDLSQHLALSRCLAAHRLNQRRYLIGALAVLVLDLAPGLLCPFPQGGDIAMIAGCQGEEQSHGNTPSSQVLKHRLLRP